MKICHEQCYVDIGVVIAINDVVICFACSLISGQWDFLFHKGGGEVDATPPPPFKVFLSFFLEDKTLAPDVFSSCSLIPHAHFETSLVCQLLWLRDMTS